MNQLKSDVPSRTTLKLTNLPTASVFIILHVRQKLFCVEQALRMAVNMVNAQTCPEVRISLNIYIYIFFFRQKLKSMRAVDEKHK